ncbi:MAG: DMP19 family protein [Prevotella sp.]|nr:DMP19 family protein [Prevotella sp.]
MKEITIKESVVVDAANRGMDEFVGVFTWVIKDAIGELNADSMATLNADQVTLLAWEILHDEVMDGGFLQLLYNGYAPFFFQNPFGKMMRLWGLNDVARLINKARKLYIKYQKDLDVETNDDEFMQLYERMPEFDDLDDYFVENEEQWMGMVACYIDEHVDKFAKVTA